METPWFVKIKDGAEEAEEIKVDPDEWEDEQKRLDREWYSMDEGYDEVHNPFAGVSEEYTKKKEDQIAQKKNQRMSAQQRQIHRDNEVCKDGKMHFSKLGRVTILTIVIFFSCGRKIEC